MSAWTGIIIGGALGGAAGFFLSKKLLHHPDVGVTGASAAFGSLVGGFLTSEPTAAAATTHVPVAYQLPLTQDFNALVSLGDTVNLAPPPGVTITSITTNNSDAIADVGNHTYKAVKLGGGVLTINLSDGSSKRIKIEVNSG